MTLIHYLENGSLRYIVLRSDRNPLSRAAGILPTGSTVLRADTILDGGGDLLPIRTEWSASNGKKLLTEALTGGRA